MKISLIILVVSIINAAIAMDAPRKTQHKVQQANEFELIFNTVEGKEKIRLILESKYNEECYEFLEVYFTKKHELEKQYLILMNLLGENRNSNEEKIKEIITNKRSDLEDLLSIFSLLGFVSQIEKVFGADTYVNCNEILRECLKEQVFQKNDYVKFQQTLFLIVQDVIDLLVLDLTSLVTLLPTKDASTKCCAIF